MLLTGGAPGADVAFFNGTPGQGWVQLFIPWEGFNGFTGKDEGVYVLNHMAPSLMGEAHNIAQEFHPYWDNLSEGAQLLMARNSFQILGHDLESPTDCVICWTPKGAVTGGTGQALRIAEHYDVPIINLGDLTLEQAETAIMAIMEGD